MEKNMKETNTNATVTEKGLKVGKVNTNGKKDLATLNKKKEKAIATHEKLREQLVRQYNTAVEKCEKSAWGLCELVYNTTNRKDFNKAFKNDAEYAKAIGKSKAYVSGMKKAYEKRAELLEKGIDLPLGNVLELVRADSEKVNALIDKGIITNESTAKEIREVVKNGAEKKAKEKEEKKALEKEREEKLDKAEIYLKAFRIIPIFSDGFEDEPFELDLNGKLLGKDIEKSGFCGTFETLLEDLEY